MHEFRTLFQIPAENLPKFEANLAKLSKKAVKLGFDPILPFVVSNEMKDFGRGVGKVRVYNVHLMVDSPKLEGWVFAGRLDHSQETGTLVRAVPNTGLEIPAEYRTAMPHCDHCNVKRYRRDSYIVCEEATGTFKQVGSTCLADFMGHDAYKIARLAEFLANAMQYGRDSEQFVGADRRFWDVESFLVHTAAAIRAYGWVSGGAAKDRLDIVSTREHALGNLHWSTHKDGGYGTSCGWFPEMTPTEADEKFAADALAWVLEFEKKPTLSDYESNVLVIAKAVTMEGRHAGLAASIVGVYSTHLARNAERKVAPGANSTHLGQMGDRIKFGHAVVTGTFTIERDMGTTYIYSFLTHDGNVVKWFASKSQGIMRGETVEIVGTVKKHGDFRSVKETVVTRARLKRVTEKLAA
jgi:hypothetical protein